jgi:DNA-directed RNA polymerase specialized sigma24 family protein
MTQLTQRKSVHDAIVARRDAICARVKAVGATLTLTQIASEFGCNVRTIRRAIENAGIDRPKGFFVRWPQSRWMGEVLGDYVVVKVLDETNANDSRYLVLRCNLCGTEVKLDTAVFRANQRRGVTRRCEGCVQRRFDRACEKPLQLTDEQARLAMRSATAGARRSRVDTAEDTVQRSMVQILLRGEGGVTNLDDIGALAFRIAQFESRRTWNKETGPMVVSENIDAFGNFEDIFEDIPAVTQSTDERERRALALAALPTADVEWMLRVQSRNKSAAGRVRFDALAAQVRGNLSKFEGVVCQ